MIKKNRVLRLVFLVALFLAFTLVMYFRGFYALSILTGCLSGYCAGRVLPFLRRGKSLGLG